MFRSKIKHIHFVGVGGSGMSGIAEVLAADGFRVSGSDRALSDVTANLESRGVHCFAGHAAAQVTGADVVVYSSAIASDNVELETARQAGVPVIPRAEMLAQLMRLKDGIAIAGAHGKTSTTSLVATILREAKFDPTVVIGGRLNALGSGGVRGESGWLVAEADESDGSFLRLTPCIAVVTNIDEEHLEHYGSYAALKEAFVTFCNRVPFFGTIIACSDNPPLREIMPQIQRRLVTYGESPQADIRLCDVEARGLSSHFEFEVDGERMSGQVAMPGRHQVLNALAALAVARELNIDREVALTALANFGGVARRFTLLTPPDAPVAVVDDYGHHPTEIEHTLRAARAAFPGQRIVAAFQPHRYTRTAALFDAFAVAFDGADSLLLTDIYPAGEAPMPGIDASALAARISRSGHRDVQHVGPIEHLTEHVLAKVAPGEVLVCLGAGSISKVARELASALCDRMPSHPARLPR